MIDNVSSSSVNNLTRYCFSLSENEIETCHGNI